MGHLMHESVLAWVQATLDVGDVKGRRVLEVGSYDVNGSVRPIVMALDPSSYLGVDQSEGPGVDVVCSATELVDRFGAGAFDIVISTEMLEHVVEWQPIVVQMVDVLAPGGLLLITTRSPGFPYHPYPVDTWRYTVEAMRDILATAGLLIREIAADPQAPGVFAVAIKPAVWDAPWRPGLFDSIAVQPMIGY